MSALELASVKSANISEFDIIQVGDSAVLIECCLDTARTLARRLGGTYKIVAVCGRTKRDLVQNLELPLDPKIKWTVSGYFCDTELLTEIRPQVQSFLKSKYLGKYRFLEPRVEGRDRSVGEGTIRFSELNISELNEKVLAPRNGTPKGLDIVVHGEFTEPPLLGYTISASDVIGFQERDFSRSYQDPTATLSPRLARIMVNLAMNSKTGTIMDPFCGLGTILQEALMCGYNVVGMDISEANIQKTRTNLNWLFKKYQLSRRLNYRLMRGDSRRAQEGLDLISGVATEPLLMPKFDSNPSPDQASRMIHSAEQTYEEVFLALRSLPKNSRIAITSPALVDRAGRLHTFQAHRLAEEAGFKMYMPDSSQMRIEYPLRVPTTKRKIVQRDLYVMRRE